VVFGLFILFLLFLLIIGVPLENPTVVAVLIVAAMILLACFA